MLIARIYEVLPLLYTPCGGQMRLSAVMTEGPQIRRILDHIGAYSEPAHISPARGPPLWEDGDAKTDDGAHISPDCFESLRDDSEHGTRPTPKITFLDTTPW